MTIAASTRQSLVEVLAAFGIVPTDIRDIRTGRMNKHWRITDASRAFALRRYRVKRRNSGVEDGSIEYEHTMLAHLAARGWAVLQAQRSSGKTRLIVGCVLSLQIIRANPPPLRFGEGFLKLSREVK